MSVEKIISDLGMSSKIIASDAKLFWDFFTGVKEVKTEEKIEASLKTTVEKIRPFFLEAINKKQEVECLYGQTITGHVDFFFRGEEIDLTGTNSYADPTLLVEEFEEIKSTLFTMAQKLNCTLEERSERFKTARGRSKSLSVLSIRV